MKMNKRILSFLLITVMIFNVFLTSCNNTSQDTTSAETDRGTEGGYVMPEDEYTLEKEPGHNQITFYWSHPGVIENADVWAWWDGKEGSGYLLYPCDYGAKAVINVPEDIEQIGFIVRTDCSDPGGSAWGSATKDFGEDRFAVIEGADTFIYLKSGDGAQYTSNDGGKTLEMIRKFTLAGITDFHNIQYNVTPGVNITEYTQVNVYRGEQKLTVLDITNMGKESVTGLIKVEETLDISKPYEIEIDGYGRRAVVPTKIFDSPEFIENYTYDGDDLGAHINGDKTTFKVWAPTASRVVLNIYSGDEAQPTEMTKGERGVWSYTADCGHGTYYDYTVTTSVGTQTAPDPYARAAGVNGDRSMVVDLSRTDPENWDADKDFSTGIKSYSDAVVWEVHVRDFSNKIESSKYKGKYLAFTERGLTNSHGEPVGVDYLVRLGVTHVHLLPVYDYATVNEADPDSGFNWGYDPKNYNVPEGSYSTDPHNGEVRIKEFKQMVMGLHEAGIGVVMDVVYNHTYDANSSFNKIVPYYYYRYTATGANSSASGCGNDTASERYMFGKFMTDSVKYWAEEYNLDGFRFDLMGLHDLQTMQEVEAAVHTVNPEAIIYGEGWTMGSTVDGSAQANQSNIGRIEPTGDAVGGIAVFNDVIRDALKGSVFNKTSKGYISGNASGNLAGVKFGIAGGSLTGQSWRVGDAMVVNYMSAHDNHTLWDKLALSNPDDSESLRAQMNRLGASVLFVSQGMVFIHAGEEMLRTKGGDENSYKSPDSVNNIDWEALRPGTEQYNTMLHYKSLIEMRKSCEILRGAGSIAVMFGDLGEGKLEVKYDDHTGGYAVAVINPTSAEMKYTLDGEYRTVTGEKVSGDVTIGAYSVSVFTK